MTLVDLHENGGVYYYRSPACTVWTFARPDSLIISYWLEGRGRDGILAEVRRLLDALHGRGDPAALKRWGYPNYAATLDAASGEVRIACHFPGDWSGLIRTDPLPAHWDQVPQGWDSAHIARLALERVDIAERHGTVASLMPIGRALAALSRFADSERVLRRALALYEESQGVAHPDAAKCLQSIGAVLAHQGKFDEAEAALLRALAAWKAIPGVDHPLVPSLLATIDRVRAHKQRHGS